MCNKVKQTVPFDLKDIFPQTVITISTNLDQISCTACYVQLAEAAIRMCSSKLVFLKIS